MDRRVDADDITPAADAQSYHDSFDDPAIANGFFSLDHANNLEAQLQAAQNCLSLNFVLDFNDDVAQAAFDLPTLSIAKLLETGQPSSANVRWINIWYPYHQRGLLELIARHYDFSPRLLALMCSDPYVPRHFAASSTRPTARKAFWSRQSPATSATSELEKGSDELAEYASISSYESSRHGNLYKINDDLWHYTSVDLGRNYICVGYNSLYGHKPAGGGSGDGLLPHCTRVWTWLLLCDDSTVISIHEDPFPHAQGRLDELQRRILCETRRNLVNVFRSLSRAEDDNLMNKNPLTLLPIRKRLGDTREETAHRDSDAPGLLFYYLFENWHNSFTLLTRRESRYGVELQQLRAAMFQCPKLLHIDRLDSIGRELGVLKRHYGSHTRIIDRLLEPQHATAASLQNSNIVSESSQASLSTIRPIVAERNSLLGVSLSSAARVRFRRLKDLIDLYALSEVEEYLKQKDALINLNFNLIAMKESLAMERLTNVTLLITKATILFLPVSLMTGYFSVALKGIEYSVAEYWISFAVVLLLSWAMLFAFGVFSGSVQTWAFFEAIWWAGKAAFLRAVKASKRLTT